MTLSQNARQGDLIMGYPVANPNSATISNNINAAATWRAISFIAGRDGNLSKVRARLASVTGSLGANDVACDLYEATGSLGVPGASYLERSVTTTPSPVATGANTWSGFTTALTKGKQYWLVFKNLNGTPASNYPALLNGNSGTGLLGNGAVGLVGNYGWNRMQTTDSGSTWSTNGTHINPFFTIEYSNGSIEGLYHYNIGNYGTRLYGAQEVGVKFTFQKYMRFACRSTALGWQKVGSPTVKLGYKIYDVATNTVIGTSISIENPLFNSTYFTYLFGYFDPTITLESGREYRVVSYVHTGSSDSTTNYLQMRVHFIENISGFEAHVPFGGTFNTTYSADQGSSWNDGTYLIHPPFMLVGDVDQGFVSHNGIYVPRNSLGGM